MTSWLQEKNRKLSYSANANGAACHGLQQLEVLRNRARLLHPETSHYMLFSKSGFDEHVAARAAQDGTVTLVDFADMD